MMFFARYEHVGVTEQGRGKDKPFTTLSGLVEKTQHLALPAFGKSQAFIPVGGAHQLKLKACSVRNQRQKIGCNAHVFARCVYLLIRNPIRVNAQGNFFVLTQVDHLGGCEGHITEMRHRGIKSAGHAGQGLQKKPDKPAAQ